MTRVWYEPDEFRLRVEGHAGATENGIDIVCAGASALAWTLVEAATERPDYNAALFIDPERAIIDVRCSPKPRACAACRYMFEIIVGGLRLIAEAHPEFLRIGGPEDGT